MPNLYTRKQAPSQYVPVTTGDGERQEGRTPDILVPLFQQHSSFLGKEEMSWEVGTYREVYSQENIPSPD